MWLGRPLLAAFAGNAPPAAASSALRAVRVALLISVVMAGAGCASLRQVSAPATSDPADPRESPHYPNSEPIDEVYSSDAEPYCGFGDNCCAVWITSWGTQDRVEDVVAFYEQIGFQGTRVPVDPETFEPDPEGVLVRWKGTREGDVTSWRRVDAGLGKIFGAPEWVTAYHLHSPDCGPHPAPTNTGIQPADPAPPRPAPTRT